MSVVIREATLEDIDVILKIDRDCSPVFAKAESYERLMSHPGAVLLAVVAEEVAGFAACSRVLDEATLLNLVVVPEVRSKGVARDLLDALLERLMDLGVSRLLLEVRQSNVIAQSLYVSAGFGHDGQRADYYPGHNGGAAETAILMSRQLGIQNASA
ncbi:ribosomal protein S18-alanine N-acetyltransferase [Congregibacter variabilis]|uniref:Ribosomal protein S18-alanine N-acetyltransferase n=1 Tax=Congregibacter variabilis TaxID=3081200 RepID=A0ABZ0I4S5_9GAMM|nr:ribosomal protein S18-alanine N-acetyltransferase [Congregibacter sp. IMCC43200]